MLIIKVSTNKAAFYVLQRTNAFNLPQDLHTESRTVEPESGDANFNRYVQLLDVLKQEYNKGIINEGIDTTTSNREIDYKLPILSEVLSPNRFRSPKGDLDRKFKLQTLKLLNYGLNAVKRPGESSSLDGDFNEISKPGEFPRDNRASRKLLSSPLGPQMLSKVLQRWRPRLESAGDDTDVDMSRIDDLLNDKNYGGRQDISVGLDLDALSAMVDDKRRKNYRGKLQSTLKKLGVIGRK